MTQPLRPFDTSRRLLSRARKTIPLGSQTFSKSYLQFPPEIAPQFIEHAKGATVTDVDGHSYTDFVNGLLSVLLGYGDPDVDAAIAKQLGSGISFSMPHRLEMIVAEQLVDMIPCAQSVRFGKNGSDATAGAVRVARAYTGRDHVAVCGYHGWQDWYIGSTARHLGVPQATRELTHSFTYNNIFSLKRLFDDPDISLAAVVMEPMNVDYPAPGFLKAVRELCDRHGTVLIFDETITGFRFHEGGAQALFNVTPDLATFGKGLANGMPLSAVVGQRDLMAVMDDIFFSFTMGGETLSLAAADAVLTKLRNEDVLPHIHGLGDRLMAGLKAQHDAISSPNWLKICGHPSWSFAMLSDAPSADVWQLKTLYIQEMVARGYLTLGTQNLSFAHSDADIDGFLQAFCEVTGLMAGAIEASSVSEHLRCKPIEPVFRVRG
ncbi:MAG: aminotransferase class III-fold pyridoxal phosphate-dependent enzyme [Pseudomonadota bacterium]